MTIYIIAPITIQGMSKRSFWSTFKSAVEKNGWEFRMVSSKQIKKQCREEFARQNRDKDLSEEIIKERSEANAKKKYNKELTDLIKARVPYGCKAYFIYLDKNHPPNAFNGLFKLVNQNGSKIDLKVIALVPLIDDDDCIAYKNASNTYSYPFSFNLFMTCFNRVQRRKDHETVNGSGPVSADATVHYLSLFENFEFNEQTLGKAGFDKILRIPFTSEEDPVNIPVDLKKNVFNCLNEYRKEGYTFDEMCFKDLNDIYEEYNFQFKDPDVKTINEYIQDFIEREIKPDVIPGYPRYNNRIASKKAVKPKVEEIVFEEMKEEEAPTQPQEIRNNYKPKKIPLYLGIFPIKLSQAEVKKYISEGLKLLTSAFSTDQTLLSIFEDIQKEKSSHLTFIDDPYVITNYIGGNEQKYKKCCKQFKQDYRLDLELFGLVIVPNKIVLALCDPDQSVIKIENKIPHMVLMQGEQGSKSSNEIFEQLFGEEGPFNLEYCSKKLDCKRKFTQKVDFKESERVYIVTSENHFVLAAETRPSARAPF